MVVLRKSPKKGFFFIEEMIKAMLGRKMNMSSVYDSHGRATPVTKVLIESSIVVQIKDKETDGYKSAQVGFGVLKKPNKPLLGKVEKSKLRFAPKVLREVDFEGDLKVGQQIKIEEVFRKGSLVDVIGKSKGRGFAGVIKRHGFAGGPKTHGQSDRHRAPGSIGATTTPGRVFKGLRMAGHMGNSQVTVFGLEIMDLDKEEGTILVKGSVPGPTGGLLLINKSKKKKEAYHEPEIPQLPNLGGDKKEEEKSQEMQTKAEEVKAVTESEVKE